MSRNPSRALLKIVTTAFFLALAQGIAVGLLVFHGAFLAAAAMAIALAGTLALALPRIASLPGAAAPLEPHDHTGAAGMTQADMFRLLINANTTPIVVVDEALGTIAYSNPAANAILFRGDASPMGRPFDQYFRLAPDLMSKLLANGGQADRVTIVGDTRGSVADLRFGPAEIGGRKWSMVVVADASAAMQAEQVALQARELLEASLKRRVDGVGKQRDNYRRMVETLKGFTSTLAHEIKNPIAVILAAAQNLASSSDPNAVKRAVRIEARAKDMTAIINRVLTAARLEANSLAPALGEARPLDLLRTHAQAAADHDAKHSYRIDLPPTHAVAVLDKELFALTLDNLLGNAAKYSPAGSEIGIQGEVTASHIVFRIIDHGIGIPDEEKTKVFTRYYRASSAKAAGISGNGLGMALCKEIIEMIDGRIMLEDAPGGGTIVRIMIPLAKGAAAVAA